MERKNCWQLAEQAGHTRPGLLQRLLRYACWDADAVRDDLRSYAAEHLAAADEVLIVDETGFLKKGRSSKRVQRQYTGTAGRIENSQVGVFPALATSRGRALIDRRLYLPEHSWADDLERRQAAGIPDEVRFQTRPRLAGEMIAAALDAGITASWVTGDEAYGQDPRLRTVLEARGTGYVLPSPARRSTGELAFYLCWSPATVSLAELVRVASPSRTRTVVAPCAGPTRSPNTRTPRRPVSCAYGVGSSFASLASIGPSVQISSRYFIDSPRSRAWSSR